MVENIFFLESEHVGMGGALLKIIKHACIIGLLKVVSSVKLSDFGVFF